MTQALPVSRLINVTVSLTKAGARAQNLSTLLVLASSAVIDVVERIRDYGSLTEVARDFGNTTPEYLSAVLWFQQSPQPSTLKVGRWAKTATNGVLKGAVLSAAGQAMSVWNAVTSGGFTYTKNGGSATNVTGINLSGATNLNGVAATITASLSGATMTWNSNFQRFELTSAATGATSTITFLTAPGSGTDISAILGMQAAQGGYRADGIASETALQAVQLFDNNYGQSWYTLFLPEAVDADHLAIAPFIEAANTKHFYAVNSMDPGVLVAATTSDIGYQLAQLGYKKTMGQYSSNSGYSVVSALARMATVDYTGNSTVITLMYKDEPGVVAENLNSTQISSLEGKRMNVFVEYDNDTAILERGTTFSGNFVDEIMGADWLAVDIQQQAYNLLYTTPTKVPQTDAGMQLIAATIESVCSQAVQNGLVAPGQWNSAGFGLLKQGDLLVKGFYVYAPPVASQNPSDRAARKSVPFQVAVKLAGAVHDISIAVVANQ